MQYFTKSHYKRRKHEGFPGGSAGKESTCNVGDLSLIPGLGRPAGGGHGNPLQYSCLENPHGQRSLVGYSPWGHKESETTEWPSTLVAQTLPKDDDLTVLQDWSRTQVLLGYSPSIVLWTLISRVRERYFYFNENFYSHGSVLGKQNFYFILF